MERSCGILCHPTCMPGPYGIGELGPGTHQFLDFLQSANLGYWQVLPLGPTGFGDSPYQPFSAFAGNPLLIGLDELVEVGLLERADLASAPSFPAGRVSYGDVIDFKGRALRRSYESFCRAAPAPVRDEWSAYCEANRAWLGDFCLFMALKQRFGWTPWVEWERSIALHEPQAVQAWRTALREEVDLHSYLQFLFARQWLRVKEHARAAGIRLIGDVPIYVGHDSADVWGHRELFRLDENGLPTVIAGVPPDYFSPTGQRWGNPHYRWDVLQATGYAWWVSRLRTVLSQVDVVRLDHFRGFSGSWEVPAQEETAMHGRWVKGPGREFFESAHQQLGGLPIIAEDLGLISADVISLRQELGLPGMRVLQFAFDSDASNVHLPHNHPRDCVVYTGTHDNDTSLGWYASCSEDVKQRARLYTGMHGRDMNWALVRLAMTSVADLAIIPLQDALGLGSESRLNQPGKAHGNWTWRYSPEQLRPELAEALRELAILTGRVPRTAEDITASEPPVIHYEKAGDQSARPKAQAAV